MKSYNTIAIQTDINGVDSNEELTVLFANALELCQTTKTSPGICCPSSSSTQYLSCENGTDCTTIKADVDYNECLQSIQAVCAQVKQEITHAREEALRNHYVDDVETCDESVESELDKEEASTSHLDVTSEEEIQCVYDEGFVSQETLHQHAETHEYPATEHQYHLEQDSIQRKNNTSRKQQKEHICHYCNKDFRTASKLRIHARLHAQGQALASDYGVRQTCTAPTSHKCKVCGKQFTQNINLVEHLRTHTGERPHKCAICDKKFVRKSHLVTHLRTHTEERPHKCEICDKAFRRKCHLRIHLQTHTGEKPYKCDICEREFGQKSHLRVHVLTHTGEKPHKCEICHRAFRRRCDVVLHLRSHTGERPHQCELCPHKGFKRKYDLVVHMRTHTGERPYKCQFCYKSFVRRSDQVFHIRTHTGERPHKCDICTRAFVQKGHLIVHLKTHTDNKPLIGNSDKAFMSY